MLAATLGFIASSFITLKICCVSSVHSGKHVNSRLNFPAKVVFSIPSVSKEASAVASEEGDEC